MQLLDESKNIDRAIAELQRAIPIAGLQNVVNQRRREGREVGTLQRRLKLWRARQTVEEASVD